MTINSKVLVWFEYKFYMLMLVSTRVIVRIIMLNRREFSFVPYILKNNKSRLLIK